MSSSPLVNSIVKNRLFKTAPDIDEPPFQVIHTMDLSVVLDTMLHDSPDFVVHRTEIWAVWRPQLAHKKVWRFLTQQFNCCTCTKSLPDTLRIAGSSMTSLWRREAASKQSVRDITSISCFVTTMKLTHALQIYSTVLRRRVCGCIFQGSAATKVKLEIKLCVCGQIISVCNSEIIIKIRVQYLLKLCSIEKRSSFLTHSV